MAPIFLSLTEELPTSTRHRVAREIAVSGFLLVIGSVLIGSPLLVRQVSDWCSGATAYFGWMREAKRENTRCGL
jgi:hypothetical protein